MDLFSQSNANSPSITHLADGLSLIKHLADSQLCLKHIQTITEQAQFRNMMTPMGHPMQVSTSNCGEYGWTSNLNGYRYLNHDPISKHPWPAIPTAFLALCQQAIDLAGLAEFNPDSCLINRYEIGHSMGAHFDKDEQDLTQPIVSVSLGLSAVFQVHMPHSKVLDIPLEDGDVLIMHGPARAYRHGVKTIKPHMLQPNLKYRHNLTLRKAF